MSEPIDFADCHINAYSRYVHRTATRATPGSSHTLPFRAWFHREYQASPGRYVGLNYAQAANQSSASSLTPSSASSSDL